MDALNKLADQRRASNERRERAKAIAAAERAALNALMSLYAVRTPGIPLPFDEDLFDACARLAALKAGGK